MKTTIYELLGLIKDGKAPKKIAYKNLTFTWNEEENDYQDDVFNDWLFDSNIITDILNMEVEILDEPKEHKKIIKIKEENGWCGKQSTGNEIILKMKVNELIDEVNKLNGTR